MSRKWFTTAYGNDKEEVYINKCNKYKTGIGADTTSTSSSSETCTTEQNKYNGEIGVKASTTGNIYGIYDMRGGADEYVMGNYGNTVGSSGFQEDFFNTKGNSKYYDKYTITSISECTNWECKGHALEKTARWYGNGVGFVSSNAPWFTRGGWRGEVTYGGVFKSKGNDGDTSAYNSFHIVMSPTT